MIRNARGFLLGLDVAPDVIERIAAALGKDLLGFRDGPRRADHDLTPFFLAYARNHDWRTGLPVSRRHFFRVLKRLRGDESQENAVRCQGWGLSLRDLGRLLGVSTPTVQERLRGAANKTAGDGI